MKRMLIRVLAPIALVALVLPVLADEDVGVGNWTAPPYWRPVSAQTHGRAALAAPTPLPFVAIAPCRVVDTRGGSGLYGGPILQAANIRAWPITGQCGIPATAQAASFNFTVTGATGPGFLTAWAADTSGAAFPSTSILTFAPGQTVSNAAVVALGAIGAIEVAAGVSNTNVIIDVNGYYAPDGIVNSVNALSGALSLTAGTNVTITPSGNTLTIAATAGTGGPPSGPAGGGLSGTYPNPTVVSTSANTPSSVVSRDGSGSFEAGSLGLKGSLTFRPGASFTSCWSPLMVLDDPTFGAIPLLKTCGGNTHLGKYAGYYNSLGSGENNTALGVSALGENTNGSFNAALGSYALWKNTGFNNTALGAAAMSSNTNGSDNTAVGAGALQDQSFASAGPNWGSANTAIGKLALAQTNATSTSNGMQNTAVGVGSLYSNTTGLKNTAVGYVAGSQVGLGPGYAGFITYVPTTTGTGNTFLGGGTGATFTAVANCTAVGSDAYCDADNQVRLGNASVTSIGGKVAWSSLSDARAKTDIRDISLGLDFVLGLRPVQYKLKVGNGRTDMGFLAQDVEALLGERYNVVGVGGDPDRTRTLRYTDLIAPLVKAIQEQQVMLDARAARVDELERRLATLEERLAPRMEENER